MNRFHKFNIYLALASLLLAAGCASKAAAEGVGPKGQKKRRQRDAPEIGFNASNLPGRTITADGGGGKKERGEQRREHQRGS